MTTAQKLILASGSPRRVELLAQAGIEPARLMPIDLDETPKRSEHPRSLARRLSAEKAKAALAAIKGEAGWDGSYILAADTVVCVGRRILPKPELVSEASSALHLLSGRSHRVYTGVCLITPDKTLRQKVCRAAPARLNPGGRPTRRRDVTRAPRRAGAPAATSRRGPAGHRSRAATPRRP